MKNLKNKKGKSINLQKINSFMLLHNSYFVIFVYFVMFIYFGFRYFHIFYIYTYRGTVVLSYCRAVVLSYCRTVVLTYCRTERWFMVDTLGHYTFGPNVVLETLELCISTAWEATHGRPGRDHGRPGETMGDQGRLQEITGDQGDHRCQFQRTIFSPFRKSSPLTTPPRPLKLCLQSRRKCTKYTKITKFTKSDFCNLCKY